MNKIEPHDQPHMKKQTWKTNEQPTVNKVDKNEQPTMKNQWTTKTNKTEKWTTKNE